MKGALNVGVSVTPPHRFLRRADPLLARSRRSRPKPRASTSSRPATTPAPKSRSSGAFARFRAARRDRALSPRRDRARRRDRDQLLHPRRRASRRARTGRPLGLGRHQRRPGSQEIGARSTARKNTSPTRASASSACSRCKAIKAGDWRFEGGARVETSRLTADADEQLGTPAATAPLHHAERLARRALRILAGLESGPQPVALEPAPRRSTNCSPTAPTPARRRSRSATPTSTPNAASASKRACAAPPARSARR